MVVQLSAKDEDSLWVDSMPSDWSEAIYYPKLTYRKGKSYPEITTGLLIPVSTLSILSSNYDSEKVNNLIGLSAMVSKSYLK